MKAISRGRETSIVVGDNSNAAHSRRVDFLVELSKLRPLLYQRALFLTGNNKPAADDLTHDAIQRTLENRHRLAPGSNLLAWSAFVMRNLFIDAARRCENRRTIELERATLPSETFFEPPGASHAELPAVAANDNGERLSSMTAVGPLDVLSHDDVLAVASTLRPIHREIFALAYQHHLPHQEIADRLGIPRSTADTRLRRVRLALRDGLERIYRQRVLVIAPGIE